MSAHVTTLQQQLQDSLELAADGVALDEMAHLPPEPEAHRICSALAAYAKNRGHGVLPAGAAQISGCAGLSEELRPRAARELNRALDAIDELIESTIQGMRAARRKLRRREGGV